MIFTWMQTRPADVEIETDNEIIYETKSSKMLWCMLVTSLMENACWLCLS